MGRLAVVGGTVLWVVRPACMAQEIPQDTPLLRWGFFAFVDSLSVRGAVNVVHFWSSAMSCRPVAYGAAEVDWAAALELALRSTQAIP